MGCNYPIRLVLLLTFSFLLAVNVAAQAQKVAAAPTDLAYANSADGLQAQFADIILAARSNDQVAMRAALDSIGIPDTDRWFAAHFDPAILGATSVRLCESALRIPVPHLLGHDEFCEIR
jgi:hypothetical protein